MKPPTRLTQTAERAKAFAARADDLSRGWLGTLFGAWDNFVQARGTHASAAVSYYAMFSLFPLFVVLVVLLSYLVDSATAQSIALDFMARFLPDDPGIEKLATDGFVSVYSLRGQVGIVSIVALLWSASGVFTTLSFNIDLAWTQSRRPNALKARLIGLLLVILLFAALLLALMVSTVSGLLTALPPLFETLGIDPEAGRLGTLQTASLLTTIAIYAGLYRWIPTRRVPWRAALIPAVLAAATSQVVNAGYSWFLGSSLQSYDLLYGPLSNFVVLMFWFYLRVLIILVGAHLGAAIARRMDGQRAATPS